MHNDRFKGFEKEYDFARWQFDHGIKNPSAVIWSKGSFTIKLEYREEVMDFMFCLYFRLYGEFEFQLDSMHLTFDEVITRFNDIVGNDD